MGESILPGFGGKKIGERRRIVSQISGLGKEDRSVLAGRGPFSEIERMSENVVGFFPLPLSVATNFVINGRARLIPVAVEEPSVVAGASFAAKLCLPGGFSAEVGKQVMVGQVQVAGAGKWAEKKLNAAGKELIALANSSDPALVKAGGGAFASRTRRAGRFLVYELLVNVQDAMGANSVNTMCERISGRVAEISGGNAIARIITNFCPERVSRATASWNKKALYESFPEKTYSADEIVRRILAVQEFAESDSARAVTHNKGIMNGISGLAVATGNDWRAVEAGAHSFASLSGKYRPLTRYWRTKSGIAGEISLPLQFGTVGAVGRNPVARVSLKILGARGSHGLCEAAASLGLAQNFAALRVLATEGIQRGHLELHRRGELK